MGQEGHGLRMGLNRGAIDYRYEEKLIRISNLHYILPAVIGLMFG